MFQDTPTKFTSDPIPPTPRIFELLLIHLPLLPPLVHPIVVVPNLLLLLREFQIVANRGLQLEELFVLNRTSLQTLLEDI
jgi:hypothetical protein